MSTEPRIDNEHETKPSEDCNVPGELRDPIVNPHIRAAIPAIRFGNSEEVSDSISNFNAFLSFSRS